MPAAAILATLLSIAIGDFVLCEREPATAPLLLGEVIWVGEANILVSAPGGRQVVERAHVLACGSVADLAAFQYKRLAAAVAEC